MKVPLLDLKAHHDGIHKEILDAVEGVLQRQMFILGPEVGQLEARVAEYCGARFGVGVSSGTDALLVALMALDIRPGEKVITTAYSFFATAGVIARLNAVPVLVDIDPASYNISPEALERAWAELPQTDRARVRAVVPVHLFGQCAEMNAILDFGRRTGVPVIEDAAQAIGCAYAPGRQAGTMGLMGCFSFFPTKNLGGIGDGGMVVTDDNATAERLRLLRNHGAKPKYYHKLVGGNFRLDTIQAAVLLVKLPYLDGWTVAREERAQRYRELFEQHGLISNGSVAPPAVMRRDPGLCTHIYNQFVVRVRQRDALREFLSAQGVGTEIYYPVPFHLQECFADLGYKEGDFPESERTAKETLALPVYPELSAAQQEYVVDTIRKFYGPG